jgi:hypothetical protein
LFFVFVANDNFCSLCGQEMALYPDLVTPQRPLSMTQPLRTPREGVRRGPEPKPADEERILGTPDYLAPEILQQENHGNGMVY